MLIRYLTFVNGQEEHFVDVELDKNIDIDTPEGAQYLNRLVSEETNLPIGKFKVMGPS